MEEEGRLYTVQQEMERAQERCEAVTRRVAVIDVDEGEVSGDGGSASADPSEDGDGRSRKRSQSRPLGAMVAQDEMLSSSSGSESESNNGGGQEDESANVADRRPLGVLCCSVPPSVSAAPSEWRKRS